MNKHISWKFYIPAGVILWIAGGQVSSVMLGGLMAAVGFILFILGLLDLRPKKTKEESPHNIEK